VRIALGSAFRNSAGNVTQYISRVCALREILGPDNDLRLIAGEGDSVDHTRAELHVQAVAKNIPIEFVECSHGQRIFGSTEEPDRLAALSGVFNAVLGGVRLSDDLFLYVEQDLRWEPAALNKLLIAALECESDMDIFAPMVMAGQHFYDTWAYRLNGDRFSPFYPYHRDLDGKSILEVDSIGSCAAMRADVARATRVRDGNAFVGWCAEARRLGYRIAVLSDSIVRQA